MMSPGSMAVGGTIGGKSAFEALKEEAMLASQSEFKKLVGEQTEAIAKYRLEIQDLMEQRGEAQEKYEKVQAEAIHLDNERESLNALVAKKNEEISTRNQFIREVQANLALTTDFIAKIREILTCLGCLNFLESPLMLECGHSVCKDCIKRHLHPFKKDSVVMCEKCT
mmetsp:Transcript_42538/g.31147  ORF Transcript_42538/g.31147 Transcript_42538/m.31147 type:complete len:168 (-) Transcript_42538:164-667(-)